MLSRRSVLAGSAAMLAGPSIAAEERVRFGVVADPQYADAPPRPDMNRYYANSLAKLREAVATFNAQDLHFVVTLGDIVDRRWSSFDAILPIYASLRHESVMLLGNHDFEVGAEHLPAVAGRLGLARGYYDFAVGAYRFVVLDGNDVSLFAPPQGDPRWQIASDRLARLKAEGAIHAKPWNGSLGDEQFAWLAATIAAAGVRGERVVVMNHYPVFPANMHNLWDSGRVVDLLTSQSHVVAYLNGHNHAGNYGQAGGVHFVNFAGMVDTPSDNAYAIVEIEGERLEITGFGREPSRSLRLRVA